MRRPILCGLDESAEARVAARLAAALATRCGAPLILLHAIPAAYPNSEVALLGPVPSDAFSRTHERDRRHGDELLQRVVDDLPLCADTETIVSTGNAATQLLETAAATGAATLVVGTRGHGRLHRALLGSVAGRVAAAAPCPVVLAPNAIDDDGATGAGPIVCGVDGSAQAADGATVAAAAAERFGQELVLAHVVSGGPPHAHAWEVLTSMSEWVAAPARLVAESSVDSVSATLCEIARRERAACLVVGSRGRGPLRSAVLGSVSASVATGAPCPVVVVPPEAHRAVHRIAFASDDESARS
jgi:nucleotide-binding universal stress UspA family protein